MDPDLVRAVFVFAALPLTMLLGVLIEWADHR